MAADQPGISALLSITCKASFELLSVREGAGARQPLRMKDEAPVDFSVDGVRQETRQLLQKLRTDEGKRVRERAEQLGGNMNASWTGGGEAVQELVRFAERSLGLKL
jgi:hypothetical protein